MFFAHHYLTDDERAAFERAWLQLQAARLERMSTKDLRERIAEVAPLAADSDLRPHVVRLLMVVDEVTASVRKRAHKERATLFNAVATSGVQQDEGIVRYESGYDSPSGS